MSIPKRTARSAWSAAGMGTPATARYPSPMVLIFSSPCRPRAHRIGRTGSFRTETRSAGDISEPMGVKPTMSENTTVASGKASAMTLRSSRRRSAIDAGSVLWRSRSDFAFSRARSSRCSRQDHGAAGTGPGSTPRACTRQRRPPPAAGHEEHREQADLGERPDPGQGAEPDEDRQLGGQADDETHADHAEGEDRVQDEDRAQHLGHIGHLGGDDDHRQPADEVDGGIHHLLAVPGLEAADDRQTAEDEGEGHRDR